MGTYGDQNHDFPGRRVRPAVAVAVSPPIAQRAQIQIGSDSLGSPLLPASDSLGPAAPQSEVIRSHPSPSEAIRRKDIS
jgi:hypothetical protein